MKKEVVKDFFEVVITVIVVSFLLNSILFTVRVEGRSMYPTLKEGDTGYSFIISKYFGINRFDIVVVNVDDEKMLVKRAVGLPGEHVQYIDNKLYINGEYIEETFLSENIITNDFEVYLGEDEYYCLGDNRTVSRDSRSYGPFLKEQMTSAHVFVLRPFEDFGYKK